MLEGLSVEVILTFTIVSLNILALCGSLKALLATRQKHEELDMDAVIRNAPYHRLNGAAELTAPDRLCLRISKCHR